MFTTIWVSHTFWGGGGPKSLNRKIPIQLLKKKIWYIIPTKNKENGNQSKKPMLKPTKGHRRKPLSDPSVANWRWLFPHFPGPLILITITILQLLWEDFSSRMIYYTCVNCLIFIVRDFHITGFRTSHPLAQPFHPSKWNKTPIWIAGYIIYKLWNINVHTIIAAFSLNFTYIVAHALYSYVRKPVESESI